MQEPPKESRIENILSAIGAILLLCTMAFAAIVALGIIQKFNAIPLWQLIITFAVSGAISVLMIVRDFTWIISGAALGSSSLLFFWLYIRIIFKNRTSFFKIEFAAPILLAIGVAVITGFLVNFLKNIFKSRIG